ncbi:MAG: hypothetical protein ABJ092_14950 [Gillisia sp.]
MHFKNYLLSAIIILLFSSCGNTKYHYHFEKGSMVDFTKGEWILNRPYTNYNEERTGKIAHRKFEKLLGDSLFSISEIRQGKILPAQLSFDPSEENLSDLKNATGKDFLINVQSNIIRSETTSFPPAPAVGSTNTANEAGIMIKIYDLNNQTLLSESTLTGIANVTRTAGDKGINYTNNAETLSMQGLIKLI